MILSLLLDTLEPPFTSISELAISEGRDEKLMAAAEKVEVRLEIVGATAIEDKLQVGVGETIERIRGVIIVKYNPQCMVHEWVS